MHVVFVARRRSAADGGQSGKCSRKSTILANGGTEALGSDPYLSIAYERKHAQVCYEHAKE
jgi:hypothetical protein